MFGGVIYTLFPEVELDASLYSHESRESARNLLFSALIMYVRVLLFFFSPCVPFSSMRLLPNVVLQGPSLAREVLGILPLRNFQLNKTPLDTYVWQKGSTFLPHNCRRGHRRQRSCLNREHKSCLSNLARFHHSKGKPHRYRRFIGSQVRNRTTHHCTPIERSMGSRD